MLQWLKCIFLGDHDWFWYRGEYRECANCGVRHKRVISVKWKRVGRYD